MATAKKTNSKETQAKKGPEDDEKKGSDSAAELKALKESLAAEKAERESMLRGVQQLAMLVKSQRDQLEKLSSEKSETASKPAKSVAADQDIESLSRKDFMALMLENFGDTLDSKLKGISERMEAISSDLESTTVTSEVERAKGKYKDFDKWKNEISVELKKVPEMAVEDAYFLARAKNPEKVKQLQEENAKDGDNEEERSPQSEKLRFGGMRPSGGGEIEERDDMDENESAEKAWEDVAEALGGEAEMNKVLGTEP